jgi:hypothetical protein
LSAALVLAGHSPFCGNASTRQSALMVSRALLLKVKFMATPVGHSVKQIE